MFTILVLGSAYLALAFILFIVGADRRKIKLPWVLIAVSMAVAGLFFTVVGLIDDEIAWFAVAVPFTAAAWISAGPADKAYYARKLERASVQ